MKVEPPMPERPVGAMPAPTESDWLRQVEKALRGRSAETLRAAIEPGVDIEALVPAGHLPSLWSRAGRPWLRLAQLRGLNERDVEDALAAGAEGFEIRVADAHAPADGTVATKELEPRLASLPLDRCHLRFAAGTEAVAVSAAVARTVARERLDPQLLSIAFGFDPIGAAAVRGGGPADCSADGGVVARQVHRLVAQRYRGPFLTADARIVAAAGGDPSSELGYALAAALAYLRILLDAGLNEAAAVAAVDVALDADADQFVTIAKFRAMRLLHARLLVAAALPRLRLAIHGETGRRMLAAEDPRSNLIRATIAALAAGIGGADTLVVLPFTAASATPDREADRLALTTQAILIEEARLHRVADPAAGSGAIERLTLALAEAGWAAFQRIEADGGLPAALATGRLQGEIAAAAMQRQAAIASGARGIVGVTLFRADGAAANMAAPSPAPAPAATAFPALRPLRDAAPFERGSP